MVDEVKLKVREALQEEAYRGIVRIDSQTMKEIGVRPGDIVEIEGVRKTVGIIDRAYPTDVGQAVVRMDGILRRNAKTSLGEFVIVRRAEVKEAKTITIAPSQKGVTIQADPIYFKRGLLGRALVKGDQVALGGARRKRKTTEEGPFQDIFDILEPEFGLFGFSGLKFIVVQTEPKQAVIVTENTEVSLSPKSVELQEEKAIDVTYEDIGGLSDEVKKIREMVELPLRHPELFTRLGIDPPKGVLLHGPPGTGKTLLAKAVANETNAHFIHLDGPAIMCVGGETEILTNDVFEKAEDLFNRSKNKSEVEYSNHLAILKLKEPINVKSIDDKLKIVDGKMTHITKLKAKTYLVKTSEGQNIKVSHNQPFAVINNGELKWKTLDSLNVGDDILKLDINENLSNNNNAQLLDLRNINNAVITSCSIKQIIELGEEILYDFTVDKYENFIATNDFLILHNSKYVGEAEKKIRDIFEEAEKNAPAIIFIDEIDAIASKREESYGEVERRVVAQLLATMDGLKSRGKVVVIAATNRPNSIDIALRRPGRFDREIEIGVPKADGRRQILKIHTRNMPIEGTVYPKNIALKFIDYINSYLNENNIEQQKIEQELNILKTKTTSDDLLDDLISKLTFVKGRIIKLEKIKRLIENKEKLFSIALELKEIYDKQFAKRETKEIHLKDEEFIEIYYKSSELKTDLEKENEVYNIVREIVSDGLIGKDIKNFNSKLWVSIREIGVPDDVDELARITHGFVGADLEVLCKEAAMVVLRKLLPDLKLEKDKPIDAEILDKLKINMHDFKEALKMVRPSALREVFIERPTITWNDIGGLDSVKQDIKEAVEWPLKYPDNFKRLGIKPPKGILLYGPPGTGKTLLAKASANESEANFILVNGPELLNKFVGESEKGIRKVFEKARQASPCIIFFDEIDAIASRRGRSMDSGVTERMVNQLLTEIDGLQELNDVIIIGATNRPDIVDPALLRPGRFDRLILTPVPEDKSRLQILKIHTKEMPLTGDVDLNVLAEKTENYVGADIESLCREAAILALRENMEAKEVTMKHFEEALKKVKPSITEEDVKKYEEIEEEYLRTARGAAIRNNDHLSYMG